MNQTDYLALGMGGPTMFMEGTDRVTDIRGFAVQAIQNCIFSRFDVNTEAFITQRGLVKKIEAVTSATDSFQVTAHGFKTGDKIVMKVTKSGVVLPTAVLSTYSREEQVYYVIEGADANNFKLAYSRQNAGAGTQIPLTGTGTNMTDCTVALVSDDNTFGRSKFSAGGGDTQPTFLLNGTASGTREVTTYVDGNVDMFNSGDEAVVLPKGMTIYVPVINITLTSGACIVYTRKGQ